jgi:hypothetical protein
MAYFNGSTIFKKIFYICENTANKAHGNEHKLLFVIKWKE